MEVPLDSLLSDEYTLLRRPLIDLAKGLASRFVPEILTACGRSMYPASGPPRSVGESSDTTTCLVADRWGNVVAATPSGWGQPGG